MIGYFDCFSGISGDMILGALVHAGVSPVKLKKELARIPVKGYRLEVKVAKRAGFASTKVNVVIGNPKSETCLPVGKVRNLPAGRQGPKSWRDIEKIIKQSALSKGVKQKGLSIFKSLFKAEAIVHGENYDKVHLHELGAADCIVDIFGALIGLELLGINKIYSSSINLGSGSVKTQHGILPVPSPAAAELLKGAPVYSSGIGFELTTPTGAALISGLAEKYCSMPAMRVSEIGLGAGNKNFKEQPNVLRLFIGKAVKDSTQEEDKITVIETNIDDMNPQVYEHVFERLFKAGALDVFLTQVIMKKGRPGIKLTALCTRDKRDILSGMILDETTSLGLRYHEVRRKILERGIKPVKTKYGTINVKISQSQNGRRKVTPEYEDCKKIAKKLNIPLLDVLEEVMAKS
jgi:uncharacterized protein (TIGR00299 family) protein